MKHLSRIVACAGLLAGGVFAGNALAAPGDAETTTSSLREATPGVFNAISSYRTMDSREEGQGKIVRAIDSEVNPDLAVARFVQFGDSNEIEFPDEAIAVTYNVTVTETEGAGFVQVDGFNFANGDTSTVNWTSDGQTVANSGVAVLTQAFDDSGALGVYLGGAPGAKAHVVLDITGFYMPAP